VGDVALRSKVFAVELLGQTTQGTHRNKRSKKEIIGYEGLNDKRGVRKKVDIALSSARGVRLGEEKAT